MGEMDQGIKRQTTGREMVTLETLLGVFGTRRISAEIMRII